jgi:iron complex transport system substrate-binding protein
VRIVSLAPSATEIVFALGLGDELVGRSHSCDYPAEVAGVPVVTAPLAIRSNAGPAGIDRRVRGATAGGQPICRVDLAAIRDLAPDLVLVQALPAGCGARTNDLRRALAPSGRDISLVELETVSVEGVFASISTIGAMADAEDESVGLLEILRERLAGLQDQVLKRREAGVRPRRVVLLQWLDPPIASGYWVPEQIRRAGGWDLLGNEGGPARRTTWREVIAVDPEQILLAPCGRSAGEAAAEWDGLRLPSGFGNLRAARRGEILALDGRAYFDRPGPRIVDGIALLAELLDPQGVRDVAPSDGWIPLGFPRS